MSAGFTGGSRAQVELNKGLMETEMMEKVLQIGGFKSAFIVLIGCVVVGWGLGFGYFMGAKAAKDLHTLFNRLSNAFLGLLKWAWPFRNFDKGHGDHHGHL